jgi:thiol:disulfide interchange protein/DsbC/DsbD-like thiol-disulfide interchange protein
MRKTLPILCLLSICLAAAAAPVRDGQVEAEWVPETQWIQPGQPFYLALRLTMDPEWHTYWRFPGDSGLATTLDWDVPPGFKVNSIEWPQPHRFVLAGLVNLGYSDTVLLLNRITPPRQLAAGSPVTLAARADWLMCKEECIPGSARISISLPVKDEPPLPVPDHAEVFAKTRAALPLTRSEWTIQARLDAQSIRIRLAPPAGFSGVLDAVEFLPYEAGVVELLETPPPKRAADAFELTLKRDLTLGETPERMEGILVNPHGWRGPGSEQSLEVNIPFSAGDDVAGAPTGRRLWLEMLGAFVGGLLLNLMPCVFPVISIKILGFVQQAGEHPERIWRHGLAFAAGVLISFWFLAGLLVGLKAGGAHIGWGFHFQSPPVVVALCAIFFVFGLNLFGVFEVGTSLTAVGSGAVRESTLWGSFLSGLLATVAATPCTAPYMAASLGYALTQPVGITWLIFTALGFGMCLPYLLLARFPALLRHIPRPGPWMETLKQFLGFLLMATVLWLLWVFGALTDLFATIQLLGCLLVMGLACWILGRWGGFARSAGARRTSRALALVLTVAALFYGFGLRGESAPAASAAAPAAPGTIPWQPFTPERLEELRADGTPVFLDFTAEWCLTCKVNERVALSSPEVARRFAELGVVALKADWTRRDETIARQLAHYGRSGVPLYVLYGPRAKNPVILRELITPNDVLSALASM